MTSELLKCYKHPADQIRDEKKKQSSGMRISDVQLQSGLLGVKATSAALTLLTELMLYRPAPLFSYIRIHSSERMTKGRQNCKLSIILFNYVKILNSSMLHFESRTAAYYL